MAAGRLPSRVFVVRRKVHDLLDAAPIPPHPVTGDKVKVMFSDEDPDGYAEYVTVALGPQLADPTDIDWANVSPVGREERVAVTIVFRSFVPSVDTAEAVWDRLETVSAEIEAAFYDTTTPAPVTLGYDGELVGLGLIVSTDPTVEPSDDGWIGGIRYVFVSTARI